MTPVLDWALPLALFMLALAMGFDPTQVAAVSQIDRSAIIAEIQSEKRLIKEVA